MILKQQCSKLCPAQYRLNVDVDSRNALMLDNLAPQSAQYTRAGQTTPAISDKRSELHGILKLAIGARVMLTTNVDVSDGLVNGARGEVVHVVINNDDEVTHVLVKMSKLVNIDQGILMLYH